MSEINNSEKDLLSRILVDDSNDFLEWPIVQKHLSTFASTSMGKKSILEFQIPSKLEDSQRLLEETIEIYNFESENEQKISFSDVFDIKENIRICSKGGVLNSKDLIEIKETIVNTSKLKKVLFSLDLRPIFSSLLKDVVDHKQLEKILSNGIEKSGRIVDGASERLLLLRKQINSLKYERRRLLNKVIQKNSMYLQDSTIGDRYGRPVLAIKVNFISKLKGIIHDSSSSGNTIFLEPDCVVNKGNQIASLKARILNEEFKLLKKWSLLVSENSETLIKNSDILLQIENALTRARYSKWISGNPPNFNNSKNISIKDFSHPLLLWEAKNKRCSNPTPIDFHIDRNIKVVAITGPNTGGKTAALKGIGIALLMAKSGLFIPSSSKPNIPFYENIYVDIGDEQSLEGNLSTFSGHIKRIKRILDVLDSRKGQSLVLLDEIGSGTDPEEGTALAIALLETFAEKSTLTIATTHYGEIKALKYKDDRFENVSVSFDENTLKPTYSLNWGIPGRSNALSISRKIGLSQEIINSAVKYLKPKEIDNINQIIKGLEVQRARQQNAAEEAAELIARTEILHNELLNNYEHQKRNAKEFQEREKAKLTKSIKYAKSEVVKLIERLRSSNANGEDSIKIGIRLREIENEFFKEDKKVIHTSWKPKVGESIKIKSLGSIGKILSLDEKGLSFKVNCGSFNSILSITEIEGINGEQPDIPKNNFVIKSSKKDISFAKMRTSKNTLDVRGLRVHEAEITIEEKMRNFHGPLWIVHGIGTGKLKKGLKSWLLKIDYVDKVEDAPLSEGGAGCSIVWIK